MSFTYAIDQSIEALCQQGCRSVLNAIEALERGDDVVGMAAFNGPERELILNELREIMSVYQFRDCALPF